MGSTKTLIIARYAGKIQRAARRSDRTVFSTTVTWNCLGKQMIAAAASNVCDTNPIRHDASLIAPDIWGNASACSYASPMPLRNPYTTYTPTARNAASFTSDSNAIASTIP
jgi:hypothetical protein